MPPGLPPFDLAEDVPLAGLTSLRLGGPARWLCEPSGVDQVRAFLEWARAKSLRVFVLGGGSNVVFPDGGFDGAVLKVGLRGVSFETDAGSVLVRAAAGESWDGLVEACVEKGLGGLECLSGIPGTVGATPVQNVGAYGAEVSATISAVEVMDVKTRRDFTLDGKDCAFGYRTSRFKTVDADRCLITAVTFRLAPDAFPKVDYPELRAAIGDAAPPEGFAPGRPALEAARRAVLALRRSKSMVLDPADPHSASAGSFFTNPILEPDEFARLQARWRDAEAAPAAAVPGFPAGPRVKVPAAWLIEHAGFPRGYRRGRTGLSPRHALALVNYGGTSAELLSLARGVQAAVLERFGVRLEVEPTVVGGL
ncbi:MAG: UDP-N-acetylmuramate dehydrogenase [Elusimicrobia bacterium]|nr:UDP-N-acetylmuramate dehydrogenase [Elusimicrobiota bacterium]